VLAISIFAAGVFWSNRRNRKRLMPMMEKLQPVEHHHNGHPNEHHIGSSTSEAVLRTTEAHSQDSEVQNPLR